MYELNYDRNRQYFVMFVGWRLMQALAHFVF